MELRRLGIALLALFILGAWDVSLEAQSETEAVGDARVAVRSADAPTASAARFLARRGTTASSPARLLMKARQQHASMPVLLPQDTSLGGAWTPVGSAQVESLHFGKVTGRVTSMAIDPSDATGNTVYVGTTGGGLWKSTNAAASASQVVFFPLTDSLPVFSPGTIVNASLSMGAVSVQPGGTGVVLAGTGDPNDASDSYYGSGLLRSPDNGATWTLATQTARHIGMVYSWVGEAFAEFAWSTTSTNLVVAAVGEAGEGTVVNATAPGEYSSQNGLYYSTDAGKTWYVSTITDGPYQEIQGGDIYGWFGSSATAVVWNPMRKLFYAAVRLHGFYSSPDGITFTRLASQPGPFTAATCPFVPMGFLGNPSCPLFRSAMAVQPATGDLFAITVDSTGKDIGLWQDVCNLQGGVCAAADAFTKQLPTTSLEVPDGSHHLIQGTYNLWLAALPAPGDTVLFAGTVDISRCSLASGCNWRNTTNSTTCGAAMVSPSQHAVDFLAGPAPGLMFFGNDGGLWRTTNGVTQPSTACSPNDAVPFDNLNASIGSLSEVVGLSGNPTDASVLLAGLGASGTAAPAVGQMAWQEILDGEGSGTAIDPANPQNWYASTGPGVQIHRCTIGSACMAADFGQAATIGGAQVGNDGKNMPAPAAFALDSKDPSQMLVGTCRVWLGPASGASWSSANAISGMLDHVPEPTCNGNALIRSLASAPAASGEWLYAGMAGLGDGGGRTVAGHVFAAHWTGSPTVWTDTASSPVVNTFVRFNQGQYAISSLVADTHDATGQTVYATVEGFSGEGISASLVYRSTDAGAHWTNSNSNLPSAPANALVIDPGDANTVYVALDTGVYVTRQISQCPDISCWSVLGTGLPNSPVTQLVAFGSTGPGGGPGAMLRAGTYGRGIWQIGLVTTQSTGTMATVSPTLLAFSDQPLQSSSASQTLVLTNTGTQPLQVSQIVSTGDFSEQNDCVTALAAQATCNIVVIFNPSQLGNRNGILTVSANVPTGQLTVALSGNGIKGADIVLLPTSMDFATVIVGSGSDTQFLTISNIGGTTVTLGAETLTGPFQFTANTCGASLAPQHGCTVGIAFYPTASGLISGSLSVTDDAGTQTASLSGTGATAASDSLAPLSLTFPEQVLASNSLPQQVTLTNSGDSAVTLITAETSGDFSVTNNCGAVLAGHSSCAFSVVFHPSRAGAQTGTLTVSDLVATKLVTHVVSLNGTGVAPAGISIAPTSLDFGGVGLGGSSAQSVTVNNSGGLPINGFAIALTGDFALTNNGCADTLAAGAACSFQVIFTPSQAGERSGNLTVTSTSAPSFNVPLSGFGEDFQLLVVGSGQATIVTGQTASFALSLVPIAGSSGLVTFSCAGAPKNATCTVSPASAQITGGNTVSIGVQVVTGVGAAAGLTTGVASSRWRNSAARGWLTLALLLPLGWRMRRFPRCAMGLVLVSVMFATTGCGVSVSGGKQIVPASAAGDTPAGSYSLTITATTPGIQRTAALSLTVN